MRLPRSPQVRKAFKVLTREIGLSLKEINHRAAKMMQRGNYAGAQEVMSEAQNLQSYLAEVKSLQQRLGRRRSDSTGGTKTARNDQHALWEYYQPILKALISLGGEAKRPAIEEMFCELADGWLLAGDKQSMARGQPRWKVMIGRARRSLKAEGFVEDVDLLRWRITAQGRKIASQDWPRDRKK